MSAEAFSSTFLDCVLKGADGILRSPCVTVSLVYAGLSPQPAVEISG